MKQKAHISMIALLLILLSLSSCARSGTSEPTDTQPAAPLPAEPSSAQTEEPQQAPGFPENIRGQLETLPDSCMAILLGEGTFLAENGESLMIDQVDRAFFDDSEFPIKASQFAVVDLDYDGTAEIVLQLVFDDKNYSDASLVLHDRDGTAYGYIFWLRGFRNLQQNGVYSFSSGAAYSGAGTLTFTEDGYIRNDIVITSTCGLESGRPSEGDALWFELSEERLAALREFR